MSKCISTKTLESGAEIPHLDKRDNPQGRPQPWESRLKEVTKLAPFDQLESGRRTGGNITDPNALESLGRYHQERHSSSGNTVHAQGHHWRKLEDRRPEQFGSLFLAYMLPGVLADPINGRVRNVGPGQTWAEPYVGSSGEALVDVLAGYRYPCTIPVGRTVYEAVHGYFLPDDRVLVHRDGNPMNCTIDNLSAPKRWCAQGHDKADSAIGHWVDSKAELRCRICEADKARLRRAAA